MAAMAQYYTVARERHNIHIVFHPIEVHQLLYVCVCVFVGGMSLLCKELDEGRILYNGWIPHSSDNTENLVWWG